MTEEEERTRVARVNRVRLVDLAGEDVLGEVQTSPTSNTVLARLKSLLTGIVIAAGTAVIGKVRMVTESGDEVTDDTLDAIKTKAREFVVETPFTGTGNLAVGTSKVAPGAAFELAEIELHLSAAPTTGTQNLVITKDDGVGPAYDLNILTIDLVANAVTDLVIRPAKRCKSTDVITAAWTNTDGRTYGLVFKHRLL